MIGFQEPRARPADRKPSQTDKTVIASAVSMPAPVRGIVENQNVAVGTEQAASVMENIFPTRRGVRVRGGKQKSATIGQPVVSIFGYRTSTTARLFATSATGIYDITALDDINVPAVSVGSQTSGYYATVQFETVGGDFMYAANGTDDIQLFNGSAWQAVNAGSTPSIIGLDTSKISHVWTHKSRVWFVEGGTKRAWYLPVDSIGGGVNSLSLEGVFQRGGSLLFGATWSSDSGSGQDDRCVFVSDFGEVAVYQGSDPSNASAWSLVGVYQMSPPLGKNCHFGAGGDLVIGTDLGLIPLSQVVIKDPSALELTAVSANIEPTWQMNAKKSSATKPWEMVKWPRENMLFTTTPHDTQLSLVSNLSTGSWAKYIGWDAQCADVHLEQLYFGSTDGFVYAAEVGGNDDGAAYVSKLSWFPASLGNPNAFKMVSSLKASFISAVPFIPQVSLSMDYDIEFPVAPEAASSTLAGSNTWGNAVWGVSAWGEDGLDGYVNRPHFTTGWVSQGKSGNTLSPQIQITNNSPRRPDAELLLMEAMIEQGGVIV